MALALGVALILGLAWGYRSASPAAVRAFQLRSAAAAVGDPPIDAGILLDAGPAPGDGGVADAQGQPLAGP